MKVTADDVARLPVENIRVSSAEFVALWLAAERHQDLQVARHVQDWYSAGVVEACRWLARAIVRPTTGPWRVSRSPVTRRTEQAFPELIEAECIAADRLDVRRPQWLDGREGWSSGIVATLNWAWRRSGGLPLQVDVSEVG